MAGPGSGRERPEVKEGQQRVRVTQVRSQSSHPHGREGGRSVGLQRSRSQGTSHPRWLGAAEGSAGDIPCDFILYVSLHMCVCVFRVTSLFLQLDLFPRERLCDF